AAGRHLRQGPSRSARIGGDFEDHPIHTLRTPVTLLKLIHPAEEAGLVQTQGWQLHLYSLLDLDRGGGPPFTQLARFLQIMAPGSGRILLQASEAPFAAVDRRQTLGKSLAQRREVAHFAAVRA